MGTTERTMANRYAESDGASSVTREDLVALLNDDLRMNTRPSFPTWCTRKF